MVKINTKLNLFFFSSHNIVTIKFNCPDSAWMHQFHIDYFRLNKYKLFSVPLEFHEDDRYRNEE